MALSKFFNRVRMTVASGPGTAAVTLGSAVSGFLSFASAGVANSNVVTYLIEDGSSFEIGQGTYTSSGTSLARDTVYITSAGNQTKINFTANAVVSLSEAKEDLTPATSAEFLTAVAKYLSADAVWASQVRVAGGNTGAATLAPDLSAGTNIDWTCTGNFTLGVPTNARVGMKGSWTFTQDGTGSRTWTLNAIWKALAGSAQTLSTAASARDRVDWEVMAVTGTTPTRIDYGIAKGAQ